jgi:hypothetical protein
VKRKYVMFVLMMLLALVLVVVLAGPASAGAKTGFSTTGTMTDWNFDNYHEFWAGITVHGCGDVRTFRDVSDDARLTGWTVFSVNRYRMMVGNLNARYFIVGHATYRTEVWSVDENGDFVASTGVWEGTAEVKVDGATGIAILTGEGHGVSGNVAGLKVKWTATDINFVQERTGYIIE